MAKILLVSHEASRTGAPRVAVDLTAGLVGAGFDVHVVVRWPGPLVDDFRDAGAAVRVEPLRRIRAALRRFRRTRRLAIAVETRAARQMLARVRPDAVWLNSALSACYARPAIDRGAAVVLHVHESQPYLSVVLDRYGLGASWPALHLVACSDPVADVLASVSRRDRREVEVLPSSVDAARLRRAAGSPTDHPGAVPLVGACGRAGPGKGFELFLGLAEALGPEGTRFVWIGDVGTDVAGDATARVEALVDDGVLRLPGIMANPYPSLAAVDVFTHLATNDSFPLVVLEAMALERPVVASALPGITAEVGDAGLLVAPGDLDAAVTAVRELLLDPARRDALGRLARQRVTDRFALAKMQQSAAVIVSASLAHRGDGPSSDQAFVPTET